MMSEPQKVATTTPRKTVLTGIRASGEPHLGNYLGAIKPAIERQENFDCFFFVADFHGLTTLPKAQDLKDSVKRITASWLAAGLDPNKATLWRQSDVPEVLELSYVLSCLTTMGLLERAHSYKDALNKSKVVKSGLFFYPVLMAADILLYGSDLVPVGKDQAQHLEMARDMATFFNEHYGEFFKLPQALILENVATVPGIDGRKMSKSYENGIDIFSPEAVLKKQIMGIVTDSKTLEEPKDPESCLVYQIFKLIGTSAELETMRNKLAAGNYGYGEAKKTLLAKILDSYRGMRDEYARWLKSPDELESVLKKGKEKASARALKIMSEVRQLVGL